MNGDRLKLHKEKLILTALWAYALSRFRKKRNYRASSHFCHFDGGGSENAPRVE